MGAKKKLIQDSLFPELRMILANNEVSSIIEMFRPLNPSYHLLFSNKTQRASIQRLLNQFSFEKVAKMVEVAGQLNGMAYAPTVTTPYELETKLGAIVAYYRKHNDKKKIAAAVQEKSENFNKWKCAKGNWHDRKFDDCSC